jgi:hypothetical protein
VKRETDGEPGSALEKARFLSVQPITEPCTRLKQRLYEVALVLTCYRHSESSACVGMAWVASIIA